MIFLLYRRAKRAYKTVLTNLSDFCDNWQLIVNVKKTQKLWSYNNVTLIAIHHSLTSKEI
jgi:hypothetical protein